MKHQTVAAALAIALSLVASASSATESSPLDLGVEYNEIKKLVVRRMAEMEDVDQCAKMSTRVTCTEEQGATGASDEPWVVFDCGFTDGIDGFFEGETNQSYWSIYLLGTAIDAVALETSAAGAGYPEATWKPALQKYEARELKEAIRIYQEETAAGVNYEPASIESEVADQPGDPHYIVDVDLKRYRESVNPSLPELQSADGCGAGESPMVVKTDPQAKRIQMIPEFFSALCKHTGRPLDGDACPYWFDVTQGQELGLAGYYRYAVTWVDGRRTVGAVDVDRLASEEGIAELVIVDSAGN